MKLAGRVGLLVPFVLVVVPACSNRNPNAPAEVSGKVTYNDAPVTGGTLTFYTKGSGVYTCHIDPDGTYLGTDLPFGDATVTVETESLNPNVKQQQYKAAAKGGQQMSPTPKGFEKGAKGGTYVKIPSQYADPKKSTLTTSLQRGKQVRDFDLKD